jgi:hypothetical protein
MVTVRVHHVLVLCLLVAGGLSPIPGAAQESAASASAQPARLSLSEIVANLTKNNDQRAKELGHYQSKREYIIDYKGFGTDLHAEEVVLVNYSAPSTVEFTEVSKSGSKLILDRAIKPMMDTERDSLQPGNHERTLVSPENYDFTMLDSSAGNTDGCSYVLGVEPKVPNRFLFRGKIWVNEKDFAICRIEAEPAKNPSFWIKSTAIHHSYMKVGDFWVPAQNQSASNIRIGGRATLTIKYEDYQIQTAPGLQETAAAVHATPGSN